jgi:Cys-tRNA(Pro)/Cys-tRNA(Cys) deacylase
MTKTEVETYLLSKNIPFEPYFFSEELDPAKTPIFKTLVLKGNKTGPVIALIPLNQRLDYKKTAQLTGNRKIG